ncbi:DNA methyltransferase [Dehalococcoides mccartyi]|nr:DNA methyltransferase [Dehalococcoides mccartyi]
MRGGAIPTSALHSIQVRPIESGIAKMVLTENHYLRSMPGGTQISLGAFIEGRLLGVLTFGVGPTNAHRLVDSAARSDCVTLTRLWLSDELPKNSESRVIGIALRSLAKATSLKFVLTYADPSAKHMGVIYQASNWIYIGESQPMSLLDFGDGVHRNARTVGHQLGTHSLKHFRKNGLNVTRVPQAPKHRYIYFLDKTWRSRLKPEQLAYPKKED